MNHSAEVFPCMWLCPFRVNCDVHSASTQKVAIFCAGFFRPYETLPNFLCGRHDFSLATSTTAVALYICCNNNSLASLVPGKLTKHRHTQSKSVRGAIQSGPHTESVGAHVSNIKSRCVAQISHVLIFQSRHCNPRAK